uniref:Uncharacterized protein n=1 Tax=Melanopsichium pennsylvanicum 4 TaxID=1398559 RepID=A0A077R9U7_9BASI|nr:uncharacterized protein BN887_06246 [Melanopsichium pennsylvanicum 4]
MSEYITFWLRQDRLMSSKKRGFRTGDLKLSPGRELDAWLRPFRRLLQPATLRLEVHFEPTVKPSPHAVARRFYAVSAETIACAPKSHSMPQVLLWLK